MQTLQIHLYSHHFTVSGVHFNTEVHIESFARNYIETETTKDQWGNISSRNVRVYALKSAVDGTYRFHINTWDAFRIHMANCGIQLPEPIVHERPTPATSNLKMKSGWTPREEQIPVIEYMVAKGRNKIIDAQTGSGKGLLNGTPVRVPSGWTNIEDLKVGDQVMGETGEYHSVVGVFPQGEMELYKLTFEDGRTVTTDENHRWSIRLDSSVSVMSTLQLYVASLNETKHCIPLVSTIDKHINMTRLTIIQAMLRSCHAQPTKDGVEVKARDNKQADMFSEAVYALGGIVFKEPLTCGKILLKIRVSDPAKLFRLGYQQKQCHRPRQLYLRIVKVEKLPYKGKTTCISVDNPTKLFVTKDYVVTHNTIMSLFALERLKMRCVLVIKPMYIERWLDDLVGDKKVTDDSFTSKEVMVVKGSAQLRGLIDLAQTGKLNSSFIIISNRTLADYYNYVKLNGVDDVYMNVPPEELWGVLGAGVRLIDEAHEHFFACYMTDLHTNIIKSISLSGTLEPDNPFLKRMYNIMYPKEKRMNTGEYKRYVRLYACKYKLDPDGPGKIKTTRRGRSSYSQSAYEESLLKTKTRKDNLLQMVKDVTRDFFMSEKLDGYKLLIFFDTIEACRVVAEALSKTYPDLSISKYTEEDPSSVLDDCDIIVGTPASCGTAVDISNLQQVHSYVMRSSTQKVLQMLGRLRQLSTDKVDPKYLYLYTDDIHTHSKYHRKLQETYRNKVVDSTPVYLANEI